MKLPKGVQRRKNGIFLFLKNRIGRKGIISKGYMKSFLRGAPVIVEAGAYKGNDTVELSLTWPKGKIYAFEPVPEIYAGLKDTVSFYSNVICFPFALSGSSGKKSMYVSGGESMGSSSLLQPKEHLAAHPNVTFDTKIEIEATTLDEWASKHGISSVDMLWLDLQGAELEVLKAATHILPTVRVIYTEVNLKENYQGADLYPALRAWLEERGFSVNREELAWEDGGNVLFVRK